MMLKGRTPLISNQNTRSMPTDTAYRQYLDYVFIFVVYVERAKKNYIYIVYA